MCTIGLIVTLVSDSHSSFILCYAHVDCEQVEEKLDEFDATRSSGHLCAATAGNFEQVETLYFFTLNTKCGD